MAILVVADDDDDLRDVYAVALRAAGHEVREAIDGASALQAVQLHRPALLLLDLWMPGLTGFDVMQALRHDSAGSRLKIVVVSNLGDADSRLEAFEAGATAYLVKGRSLADLIALVDQTLDETLDGLSALAD